MSRFATPILGALIAIGFAQPASGQSAGALGKPIPDASLAAGSVIIRVVKGTLSRPVSSLEVALVDEGTGKELVVRTDLQGRAEFRNLGVGKTVTAFAKVGDVEMSSDPLVLPKSGGLRVLLSPTPITSVAGQNPGASGPGAGGPSAGGPGPGGMPDPRQMSGVARPEQNDPPGQLTVRTIQGAFRIDPIAGRVADPAEGSVVHLVGYGKGGVVKVVSKTVDDGGRAQFNRLAKDNSISYWVLSSFVRNGPEGPVVDRLQSSSVELLPQVGLRLMLAGHARDSNKPPVDDLPIFRQRKGATLPGPGVVSVELAGQAQGVTTIELVDATTGAVLASKPPAMTEPVTAVRGTIATPVADPALRDGLLQVKVGSPSGPLPGAVVRVFAAGEGGAASGEALAELSTDANGLVNITAVPPATSVVLSVTGRGKEVRTDAFKTPQKGGAAVIATWNWQKLPQTLRAEFDAVPSGLDKLYFARAITQKKKAYLSPPLQMVGDRGAVAGILIYPELLVGFQGGAELDDNRLWFQMRFSIANPSLAPLDTGKKGLLIPLPPGFVGASVADEMASRVTVDNDHGFIWKGAFPPGQRDFMAQFAMPVVDGDVDVAMPLPYGVFNSHLIFEDIPGMTLEVPSNAKRESREGPGGRRFIMLRQINVRAGQTLKFSVRGLPIAPSWKRRSRIVAGVVVLGLLIWGFATILISRARESSKPASTGSLEQQRESLLARVIALDERRKKSAGKRKGKGKGKGAGDLDAQRAALLEKLEVIYKQLGDV